MIRRLCLLLVLFTAISVAAAFGQTIVDVTSFDDMEGWTVASGDWTASGNRLYQRSTSALMARIDREVPAEGEYEIRFNVRYEDGAYRDQAALAAGQLHGGFGVHVGLSDPLLGTQSWGAGESYLLWMNLDTRSETASDFPVHYGLRAQVYESHSPTNMDLLRAGWAQRALGDERVSIDVEAAYAQAGGQMELADLEGHLSEELPMRIRVNPVSGVVRIADPTGSGWFELPLDASTLRDGNYLALRTNSLSVSFGNFRIVEID